MVWCALQFQERIEQHLALDSIRRLLITSALAAGVFLGFTSDRDGRWKENLTTEFLTPDNPALAGWLPEPGGVIHSPVGAGEADKDADTGWRQTH
jgi:hypothetical protein